MNPGSWIARLALAIALVGPVWGQSVPGNLPPEVQHFGPLVVVAFNEASADPITLRGDLLGGTKAGRMRVLQAMGIDSSPELRDLWASFLHSHSGQSDDKGVMQFISGGMLGWNFGDPGSEPIVLEAGFDEPTDHPLEFRGVFVSEKGQWRHVATVACRCQMGDEGEPLNIHPGHPDPPQEWVISLFQRDEGTHEYQRTEIRFRLRDRRLWPLIQYIGMKETCPSDSFDSPLCGVTETNLDAARLITENGSKVAGFALVSWSGHPPKCEKCGMLLYHPQCSAYVWDENAFAYLPSPLKPKSCGIALPPQKAPPAAKGNH